MAEETVKPTKDASSLKAKLPPPPSPTKDANPASTRPMDVAPQTITHTNVTDQKLPNGLLREQLDRPVGDGPSPLKQLPPEIEHITEDFHPLSRLFGRASQECYNALNDLLSKLSEVSDAPQANGVPVAGTSGPASDASAQMRTRWLEFAHRQRQRFIKLLVVSQWSRRAPDVSQLIDIFNWARKQEELFNFAELSFGNVKRGASVARVPQPNISTALEVLRQDRQPELSDLDYLPSKPLPAKEVLDTLQNLNVLLHVRLNLHETLPPYLRQYSISNGKVTFTVPQEFEVDLAIADEDPDAQFWFQDVRLLFTSTSGLPAGQLGSSIEQRVNSALATHGLAGCFEVLHEFALTLKITTLRQQALQLSRGSWAGALKVEQLNRSLVVQYWSERPGKKSWIQIGVKKGQPAKYESWEGYWPSTLFVKWMRHGKEVHDISLPMDILDASTERILNSIIAQHITSTFTTLKGSTTRSNKQATSLAIPALLKSAVEPAECALRLPPRSNIHFTVLIEPVSGKFVLQPASMTSSRFENELNSLPDPVASLPSLAERWQASEVRQRIKDQVESAGWLINAVPGANRDSVRKALGPDIIEVTFIKKAHWGSSPWHIVIASQPAFESLWLARVTREGGSVQIREKEPLEGLSTTSLLEPGSEWAIQKLEGLAVTTISILTIRRRLMRLGISSSLQQATQPSLISPSSLIIDTKALLHHSGREVQILADSKIILENATYSDTSADVKSLTFVATGRLRKSVAATGVLDGLKGRDFSFTPNGPFSLNLKSELGSSTVVDLLISRLRRIERLGILLNVMRSYNIKCHSVELNTVTFEYATNGLRAVLAFEDSGILKLERLEPRANPHNRIMRSISGRLKSMRSDIATAFNDLLRLLVFTLPLLQTFDALEIGDPGASRSRITTHGVPRYAIRYPQSDVTLTMDLVSHRGEAFWYAVIHPSNHTGVSRPSCSKFVGMFKELSSQSGEGWWGLRSALIATPSGVGDVVMKLDSIARTAAGDRGDSVLNGIIPPTQAQLQTPTKPKPAPQPQQNINQKQNKRKNNQNAEVVVID